MPSVIYDEAVEEALCFGWIDTRVRTSDAGRYEQRFTPRKAGSTWSQSNIERMKKMLAARKVVATGRAAFDGHEKRLGKPHPTHLSDALEGRFRRSAKAWKHFKACPPGYQRMAIGWVASAKRDETQQRRLDQLIATCARGARLAFV